MIIDMNKILIILLLTVFFLQQLLTQQAELPYLTQVEMKCAVTFDTLKGIYTYYYSLRNGVSSNVGVQWFEIDVRRNPKSIFLDSIGLQFKNSRIQNAYRRTNSRTLNASIPISFPSLPLYGDGGLTENETAILSAGQIKPGGERDGFVLSSKGLPAIRNFTAVPIFDPNDYYPSVDNVGNPDSLARIVNQEREAIKYHGYTIGPSAPLLNFISTAWCDTISNYITQSNSLGWIPSQATANKYLGYFSTVKTQLQANDGTGVRTILQAVLVDANADSTTNLASEAYALIRYNTEYLMKQLSISSSK